MPHETGWEIWLDCNISPIIAKWINEETNLTAKSAFILGLHGLLDEEIYLKAKQQGNVIIISKDSDIRQLITRFGAPPKMIELISGNMDNRLLWKFMKIKIERLVKRLIKEGTDIITLDIEEN